MERARDERKEINRGETGDQPFDNKRGEQPDEIQENEQDKKKDVHKAFADKNKDIDDTEYDPSDDSSHESNPNNANDQVNSSNKDK